MFAGGWFVDALHAVQITITGIWMPHESISRGEAAVDYSV
jgi:hypothetical protein